MAIKIDSSRPVFADFPAQYERVIAPFLESQESARAKAVAQFYGICGGAAVLALFILVAPVFGGAGPQFAFFAGAAGVGAATWVLNRSRRDISHGLFKRIATILGFDYQASLDAPDYLAPFLRLKLLPAHDTAKYEDQISGEYEGAEFTFCEAHLEKESRGENNSRDTVFHGQLICIAYPKRFQGETVLRRDAGVLNRLGKPGKGFQNIGLASPKFEKVFEAWATDQVEARDILDPVVLERFIELERLFKGGRLSAAFTGGKVILSLSVGDKLNMGSMFKPLNSSDRVETIIEEFDVIFDLIDLLIKRAGRMDGAVTIDRLKSA